MRQESSRLPPTTPAEPPALQSLGESGTETEWGNDELGAAENESLKDYLAEIARVRATGAGTGETSYYAALQGVLNAIGAKLRPSVYCLGQMSGAAGFPDFGLFTDTQFGRGGVAPSWAAGGPLPERGVIEADARFVQPDGSIGWKLGWWRIEPGSLIITGRRLDAVAPPLRVSIPDGYGREGFQASGVTFPTDGCWEVTGLVGDASLTFVTYVVRA